MSCESLRIFFDDSSTIRDINFLLLSNCKEYDRSESFIHANMTQTEFYLVHDQKEICHYDRISLNLKCFYFSESIWNDLALSIFYCNI